MGWSFSFLRIERACFLTPSEDDGLFLCPFEFPFTSGILYADNAGQGIQFVCFPLQAQQGV